MKGARLIIMILITLALALATLMVSLNLQASWSQYARSLEEPLLFATLSSISSIFLIRSLSFSEKNKSILNIFIDIRIKHINRITGFLFIGVLCTPVTHPFDLIVYLHYIFTGLAILTAYLEIVFYNKKEWAYLITAIGVIGFVLAFVFHLYSVGLGELIAALPIAFNIVKHRNKIL